MKKIFPVLFVVSTSLIAVVGVLGSTNSSFRELRAEEHSYTITFTKDDITSSSTQSGYQTTGTFTFSKQTQSGFDFGCTATVKGDYVYFNKTNKMVEVDASEDSWTGAGDGVIQMEFQVHDVLSATSVTLNGSLWDGKYETGSLTYTTATTISDGYKISINETSQKDFYITSIVVKYTCGY